MRFVLILAMLSGTLTLTVPEAFAASRSPAAKWCLSGGGQNINAGECVYRSLGQCNRDRIGQGGHCDPNASGR